MSLKIFYNEIKKGLPCEVYYLYKADFFIIIDIIKKIKELIPEDKRAINIFVYDINNKESLPSISEIIEQLNTSGFFGDKKFVVLYNIHSLKSKDFQEIVKYIKNPNKDNTLILISKEPPIEEKIFRKFPVICIELKGNMLFSYIKDVAVSKGLKISKKAIETLIEIGNSDIGFIVSELEKLSLLGKNNIDVADILELFYNSKKYSVFHLADAILEKNKQKTFHIFQNIPNLEPISTLGAFNWKFYNSLKKKQKPLCFYKRLFEILLECDLIIKSSSSKHPFENILFKLLQS